IYTYQESKRNRTATIATLSILVWCLDYHLIHLRCFSGSESCQALRGTSEETYIASPCARRGEFSF
ncbi:MAG: hypothetical protein WBQ95_22370, partial [Terracidiphilus sp.]